MDTNASDPACEAYLADRKYFNIGNKTFVKRTLRPSEWTTTSTGVLLVPSTTLRYRLENEAACLDYLAGTSIPVPALRGVFQDDGAVYLMTEYIDGIPMSELGPADKEVVRGQSTLDILIQLSRQHMETRVIESAALSVRPSW